MAYWFIELDDGRFYSSSYGGGAERNVPSAQIKNNLPMMRFDNEEDACAWARASNMRTHMYNAKPLTPQVCKMWKQGIRNFKTGEKYNA